MKQSKQIAINTISSWAGIFANVAVLIFLTKFLLNRLSLEQFGLLRYVLTIQASFLFLDLGLSVTLNRYVSQFEARGDLTQLNAAISLTFFLFLGLGLIAGLILSGMGIYLPALVAGCTPELYSSGLLLMICIGATLTVRFWRYTPRGVLFGLQKHFVVNAIITGTAVLRAIAIVVLFLMVDGTGLVTVGFCFLGCAVLETSLMWFFAKSQFPQMKLGVRTISRSVAGKVLGFSLWAMLMSITNVFIANAPTFLAGRLYGAEGVTFISLPLLILSQLQRVTDGFGSAIIPVAGKYGALDNRVVLQQILSTGTKFCAILCFPLALIVTIFGAPLLEWLKEGLGWTSALLAIMVLPILIRATQKMSTSVLMGAGSIKGLALGQIVVVIAIGILSFIFAVHFKMKLYGIALGTAIPIFFFDAIYRPLYACRQIDYKWLRYMVQSYGKVAVGVIPSAMTAYILLRYAYPKGLIMVIVEGVSSLLVFAVIAWFFILTGDERHNIFGLFKSKDSFSEQIIETSEKRLGRQPL